MTRSAFAGFRFPPDVIVLAVRWHLRYGLSYRDVVELLAEAARTSRHCPGNRWFVDETYVKVASQWRYVYWALDQFGQVVDVLVFDRRNTEAAQQFFIQCLANGSAPREVTTDRAPALARAPDEVLPQVLHDTEQYANNTIECDHGRLKSPAPTHARGQDQANREHGDPGVRVHPEPEKRPL